jgi:hypothetical protein
MNNRDLNFLNLRDLKSVAKYYRIEHKSRIKRVELEALIYMAEHVHQLEIIHYYNNQAAQAVPHSVLGEHMQIMDIVPDTSSNSP